MKKNIISTLFCVFLGLLLITKSSFATGVFLDSTRIIFPLSKNETSVKLINTNDYPVLVQMWIDDGNIEQDLDSFDSPVVILPPLVKLNGKESRIIRLILAHPPKNQRQETVFWFNSREIAPEDNQNNPNSINFVVTNRLKLFLRPKQLIKNGSNNWVDRITCRAEPSTTKKQITCHNPTDYFATISHVYSHDANGYYHSDGMMLPPQEKHTFTLQKEDKTVKQRGIWITVVGDNGYHVDKSMK